MLSFLSLLFAINHVKQLLAEWFHLHLRLECVNGYFLDGSSMCQPCPDGSSSDNSLSISCTCVTGRATASGSSTTTVDECSGEYIG